MEKVRKLYPMKFRPITEEHQWGEEKILLADLGIEDSEVEDGWLKENTIGDIMETYMERIVGDSTYGYYGRQFPVTLKILDIKGKMPVRVHPDDETAGQRYDSLGGKELWYVMDAGKDARIYAGFSRDVSAGELYDRCMEGTVMEAMNAICPKKGDFIQIEPGMVHSAGNGLRIAVIKEASELPFTLAGMDECTDGGDPAEHLAEALDFITLSGSGLAASQMSGAETGDILAECPEYNVRRIVLSAPLKSHAESRSDYAAYICTEGEASFQVPSADESGTRRMDNHILKAGEAILVPAEVQDFFAVPADRNTVLLEITPGKRDDTDDYINPDTEPFLEGEDYEGLEDENEYADKPAAAEKGEATSGKGRHDMKWK